MYIAIVTDENSKYVTEYHGVDEMRTGTDENGHPFIRIAGTDPIDGSTFYQVFDPTSITSFSIIPEQKYD